MAGRQTLLGPVLTLSCSETSVSGYTDVEEHKPVFETIAIPLRLAATPKPGRHARHDRAAYTAASLPVLSCWASMG